MRLPYKLAGSTSLHTAPTPQSGATAKMNAKLAVSYLLVYLVPEKELSYHFWLLFQMYRSVRRDFLF